MHIILGPYIRVEIAIMYDYTFPSFCILKLKSSFLICLLTDVIFEHFHAT